MNFASFIPLVGCTFNLFLAIFVAIVSRRSTTGRIYFFWGISIATWNLGQFLLFTVSDPHVALLSARFCWFGVIFIPVLLYHISVRIANMNVSKKVLTTFYGVTTVLAGSNFTPLFVSGVRKLGESGWYAIPGPFLFSFYFLFTVVFFTIYVLIKHRRNLGAVHKSRIDPLIGAQSAMVLLGSNDLLPVLGIDYYPFTESHVYPYGSLAAVFYGIIVGYSVLQHHLLDVRIQLSRVAAQFIRFVFLFLIGIGLLLASTLIFPHDFQFRSFVVSLTVIMLTGAVASLLFPRLFGKGSESIERKILGDRFDYQDRVRAFINELPFYSDTDLLLSDLDDLLSNTVGIKHFRIILLDENTHVFKLFRAYPPEKEQLYPEINTDCSLIRYFQKSKEDYLLATRRESSGNMRDLEEMARQEISHFRAQFCFLFRWEEKPFGILLLGDKTSNDPFTENDISLISLLVKNISIIVNQIRLKDQILHVQELELLGRMSRGMAHDLNNLLTPIWTFLQLTSEGIPPEDLNDDLLPVALRNIKTMRAYIREALFFSEHLRPDIQSARLDTLLQHAADLVKPRAEKRMVNVAVEVPTNVQAELDEVLVQRMMANLIANAIDASPEHSTVRVELVRLVKTEVDRDWLRVRVIDQGEGIKQENLDKVLTPYFTTKNSGDETRGFGLGLTICKKIVHLHGGHLNISSQWKKGTTVQVDLPSQQIKALAVPAVLTTS